MQDYLTAQGKEIYKAILKHLKDNLSTTSIDTLELSMLANSFDLYHKAAEVVKEKGMTQTANSGFQVARPELTIMKVEHGNILKHSDKFGLNPSARKKIFKLVAVKDRKVKGFLLHEKEQREVFTKWWKEECEGEVDFSYLPAFLKYVKDNDRISPTDLLDLL